MINTRISKVIRLSNRQFNRKNISNKVFCIGLHKMGTTSLANFFIKFGFDATHTTDWVNDTTKLKRFDFFSDGGSHFDDINEFDFERLFHTYKKSKFIFQTRDTEKWVISKLKHAGWNKNTIIQEDDSEKIIHDEWTYKSLLTVQKFIEHKYNYEKRVLSFFKENDPSRLLIIDITQKATLTSELSKLTDFLNLKSINEIKIPHSNKRSSDIIISEDVHDFIKQVITTYNKK